MMNRLRDKRKIGAWITLAIGMLLLASGGLFLLTRPADAPPPDFKARVVNPPARSDETSPSHEAPHNRVVKRKPFKPAQLTLNSEEKAKLEEIEAATQEMTRFLDDGDEMLALTEARELRFHSNRDIRLEAFLAMDWIGLPAAIDLAEMIDDEDHEIRTAARDSFWKTLHELKNPTVQRDLLSTALQSSDSEMRESALDELINIPDRLSFELLAKTMLDMDENVADLARENAKFVSGETFESYEEAMRWFEENKPAEEAENDESTDNTPPVRINKFRSIRD